MQLGGINITKIKGTERIFCVAHSAIDIFNKNLFPSITGTRASIRFIGNNNGSRVLTGVEVGVRQGYNAKSILSQLPINKLYLVDPYRPYWENNILQPGFSIDVAKRVLVKFSDKIVFVRSSSADAIGLVPDDLDFVYIDGCHEPEFIRLDLQIWYPKICSGGVLAGHDLHDPLILKEFIDFFRKHEQDEVHALDKDWWLVKK